MWHRIWNAVVEIDCGRQLLTVLLNLHFAVSFDNNENFIENIIHRKYKTSYCCLQYPEYKALQLIKHKQQATIHLMTSTLHPAIFQIRKVHYSSKIYAELQTIKPKKLSRLLNTHLTENFCSFVQNSSTLVIKNLKLTRLFFSSLTSLRDDNKTISFLSYDFRGNNVLLSCH